MVECSHECGSCSESCEERDRSSWFRDPNPLSSIKRCIGVVSGKGGVGKSLVTSLLAVAMNKKGKNVAIFDADITGPSIPHAFPYEQPIGVTPEGLYPARTAEGIQVLSIAHMLPSNTEPVLWRGPVIASTVTQFWTDVVWKDVDYMFIDMPPGTGDVAMTVFQSLPIDGVVIVASPQDLVSEIVEKAINMAEIMEVPVLGVVENMAYFECPDCHKVHYIFGEKEGIMEVAKAHGIHQVAKMPIDPTFAQLYDEGQITQADTSALDELVAFLETVDKRYVKEDAEDVAEKTGEEAAGETAE